MVGKNNTGHGYPLSRILRMDCSLMSLSPRIPNHALTSKSFFLDPPLSQQDQLKNYSANRPKPTGGTTGESDTKTVQVMREVYDADSPYVLAQSDREAGGRC